MSVRNWQQLLDFLTEKDSYNGTLKSFEKITHTETRFKVCYIQNKRFLEDWLAKTIHTSSKCTTKCIELRLSGNEAYKKGKDFEALNFYNKSVATAVYSTNEFALALSNRSAVLTRFGHSKDAIRDIDLALQQGDHEIPRTKLLIRKAILLYRLHSYKDALDLIKSLYPNDNDIQNHTNKDLKIAYFDCLQKSNAVHKPDADLNQPLPLPKGGENDLFPSASTYLSLEHSEEKGRYVIANADFEKFDILFVEKPFALVVLPDQYKQHCHHCCKAIIAFIPCEECTRALFCSTECQVQAWARYHKWECGGLDICHHIGIAHLGLRVALMADESDQYRRVSELLTHIDDMVIEDIYQYIITAGLLTLYLERYTSYFEDHPTLRVNEMGCRILRHIAQLICNGHAITKIDVEPCKNDSKIEFEEQVRIATAIYPSVSMLNHSCDQNITNSFINECLVVKASRRIGEGEEVFNCYGPNYKKMSREERKQILKSQYFFSCTCSRCSDASTDGYLQFTALQCTFCSGPVMEKTTDCAHCNKFQPLLKQTMNMALVAEQAFHRAASLEIDDLQNAQSLLEKSFSVASKSLYKHNSDLRHYKNSLALIYCKMGKYEESIKLLEECVETIKVQFGVDSIELYSELAKLVNVMSMYLDGEIDSGKQLSDKLRYTIKKRAEIKKQIAQIIATGIVDNELIF